MFHWKFLTESRWLLPAPMGAVRPHPCQDRGGDRDAPTGRILLDGEEITALDVTQRARKGLSFAFQQPVRFKGADGAPAGRTGRRGTRAYRSKASVIFSAALDYAPGNTWTVRSTPRFPAGRSSAEIATVLARHTRLSVLTRPEAGIDLWSLASLIDVFQKLRGTLSGFSGDHLPSGTHPADC